MSADALQPLRDVVDAAASSEPAAFARAARNAVARAVLTASFAPGARGGPAEHEPPEAIGELLGSDVGAALAALYRGGDGWTSRAIDLLEPLNELAHAR